MRVLESDLPEGWRFERKSERYCVWFDDQGRRYKSSKEVEAALMKQGCLAASDYETEPETASEYEPSPAKKPRDATSRWEIIICREMRCLCSRVLLILL